MKTVLALLSVLSTGVLAQTTLDCASLDARLDDLADQVQIMLDTVGSAVYTSSHPACGGVYGAHIRPANGDEATYLIDTLTQGGLTKDNPQRCCEDCIRTADCKYYSLNMLTGQCKLYRAETPATIAAKRVHRIISYSEDYYGVGDPTNFAGRVPRTWGTLDTFTTYSQCDSIGSLKIKPTSGGRIGGAIATEDALECCTLCKENKGLDGADFTPGVICDMWSYNRRDTKNPQCSLYMASTNIVLSESTLTPYTTKIYSVWTHNLREFSNLSICKSSQGNYPNTDFTPSGTACNAVWPDDFQWITGFPESSL